LRGNLNKVNRVNKVKFRVPSPKSRVRSQNDSDPDSDSDPERLSATQLSTDPACREIVPVHSGAVHVLRTRVRERERERLCHHGSKTRAGAQGSQAHQSPINHGGLQRNQPYLCQKIVPVHSERYTFYVHEYEYGNENDYAIMEVKLEQALRVPRLTNHQSITAVCGETSPTFAERSYPSTAERYTFYVHEYENGNENDYAIPCTKPEQALRVPRLTNQSRRFAEKPALPSQQAGTDRNVRATVCGS
jgi:hypothetical protein